jgi:hypothetical protein
VFPPADPCRRDFASLSVGISFSQSQPLKIFPSLLTSRSCRPILVLNKACGKESHDILEP